MEDLRRLRETKHQTLGIKFNVPSLSYGQRIYEQNHRLIILYMFIDIFRLCWLCLYFNSFKKILAHLKQTDLIQDLIFI